MFSKAKNEAASATPQTGLVEIGDAPEQPAPKKSARSEAKSRAGARKNAAAKAPSVPSLISSDVVITGSIEAEGEVHFDGVIEGNISARDLHIGEGAVVTGEIRAEKVKVAGTVEGTIRAAMIELAQSANVTGDIIHTALSIENGARFEGTCSHSDTPLEAVAAPVEEPAPARPAPAPLKSAPKTVAAAEPAPAPAPAPSVVETPEEPIITMAAETEEDVIPAVEEKPRPPVLKSLPGGNQSRPSSPFLNRGGKPDLR